GGRASDPLPPGLLPRDLVLLVAARVAHEDQSVRPWRPPRAETNRIAEVGELRRRSKRRSDPKQLRSIRGARGDDHLRLFRMPRRKGPRPKFGVQGDLGL